jgi:hypothetical protein
MARMSREFTLVLLGSTLLTAGYFLWPDDRAPADPGGDGSNGSGGNSNSTASNGRYYRTGGPRFMIFPIITTSTTSTAAPRSRFTTSTGTRVGGFGRTGFRFGGS